jgi:hypothetical protein
MGVGCGMLGKDEKMGVGCGMLRKDEKMHGFNLKVKS